MCFSASPFLDFGFLHAECGGQVQVLFERFEYLLYPFFLAHVWNSLAVCIKHSELLVSLLKLLVSLLNAADKNREYDWRSEYIKARCSVVCFCHSLLRRDGLPGISIALQMDVEWQGLLEHPSISLHHMSLLLSWLFRTFWWFGSSG